MRVFSALYLPLFNPVINMDEFLLVRTEFAVQETRILAHFTQYKEHQNSQHHRKDSRKFIIDSSL